MENEQKLPKICVIMSTYNGEKYLKVQIDSILNQKNVDLTLHIFDDISTDKTVEIAKEYESKNSNVFVHVNEKNKNFTYNFLDALFSFKDNDEFDYYAFADQDDFWLDEKLIRAITKIQETGECTLYSSNLKVVNENLEYQNINMVPDNYKSREHNILGKNIVTGCTVVIDKSFKNLATMYYPENIYCHDYWLAIIANYTKDAHYVYDSLPDNILYRQHGNNLIGANNSFIKKVKKFLFKKMPYEKTVHNLLNHFYNLYKEHISEKNLVIINNLLSYKKFGKKLKNLLWLKGSYSFSHKIKLKIKMFLNKY